MLYVLLLCFPLAFGQASGSSDIKVTFQFDWKFPIDKIKIYVFEKSGNYFEKIECTSNPQTNSITLSGRNHFITGVRFPTLVCSYEGVVYINNKPYEKNKLFYIITDREESIALDESLFLSEQDGVVELKSFFDFDHYHTEIIRYQELMQLPNTKFLFSNSLLRLK
ncbi:MAG: hypothetical protein RLZZ500_2419 [Bacteroidota bacterium]